MSRVEQIGDCTLHLGDCRDILPRLGRVDAVVTDPPYGIGAATGIGKVTKEGSDFRGRPQWDDAVPEHEVFNKLLSMSTWQIIWGGNYFGLPSSRSFLVWDKVQPEDFSLAMAEMAWTNLQKPAKIFRHKSMSINGGKPKHHPTQKPLKLMLWCLRLLPFETGSVLDAFMGSGSTGVACARAGFRFVGIESDVTYFDVACRRIEDAYKQPDMFVQAPRRRDHIRDLADAQSALPLA